MRSVWLATLASVWLYGAPSDAAPEVATTPRPAKPAAAKPTAPQPAKPTSAKPIAPAKPQAGPKAKAGQGAIHTVALREAPKPEEAQHPDEPGNAPLTIDEAWASKLSHSDLSSRFSPRVLRYLEFYRDDPRGKASLAIFHKRSGRFREGIRDALRKRGLPEDLVWLAMVESGFDERVQSPAGALGLWQFMPDTARNYGLLGDRWVDQRMNIRASTEAALDMFADLYRRFGSWELAMAAYNMGPGALSQAIRRFNSNDYVQLCEFEGAIPWETTLYVPKIVAIATAMRNPNAFALRNLPEDAPPLVEDVSVPPGVLLETIAQATSISQKDLETLNPELLLKRTPPGRDTILRVPVGKGTVVMQKTARYWNSELKPVAVQAGESLDQLAARTHTSRQTLAAVNQIGKQEVLHEGTTLLVPKGPRDQVRVVVIVPQEAFVYPGRMRVFHRVQAAETLDAVAQRYHVQRSEILRWNTLDSTSTLLEGMTLQLFVGQDASPTTALREQDVRVVTVGSEDFFALTDPKGRARVPVVAKTGDTLASIARDRKVSPALLERINRRGRNEVLTPGTVVYVYVEHPGSAH